MIICEYGFDIPDKKNPTYSNVEDDFYRWIPAEFRKTEEDHMLTLRKNLKTGEFELLKNLFVSNTQSIILKTKDLQEVLNKANELWNYYHSKWAKERREPDIACKHKVGEMSDFCMLYQKAKAEMKAQIKEIVESDK